MRSFSNMPKTTVRSLTIIIKLKKARSILKTKYSVKTNHIFYSTSTRQACLNRSGEKITCTRNLKHLNASSRKKIISSLSRCIVELLQSMYMYLECGKTNFIVGREIHYRCVQWVLSQNVEKIMGVHK